MTLNDSDSPLAKALQEESRERQQRAKAHELVRSSADYQDALKDIQQNVAALLNTLNLCELVATRWDQYGDSCLFPRHKDDVGEAILVAQLAIENGALNAARRELRHAIEVAVNTAYVDEAAADQDLNGKLNYFRSKKVNKANADHIRDLRLIMLGEKRESFIQATIKAWSDASNYVHLTKRRMDEKLSLRAAGVRLGLETPEMLTSVADEVYRVCCIIVVLAFESIGPVLTGDILVGGLEENKSWPFHDSPFVAAVDSFFDYKHERQAVLAEIQSRRSSRRRT